jgi:hypothetical protein
MLLYCHLCRGALLQGSYPRLYRSSAHGEEVVVLHSPAHLRARIDLSKLRLVRGARSPEYISTCTAVVSAGTKYDQGHGRRGRSMPLGSKEKLFVSTAGQTYVGRVQALCLEQLRLLYLRRAMGRSCGESRSRAQVLYWWYSHSVLNARVKCLVRPGR